MSMINFLQSLEIMSGCHDMMCFFSSLVSTTVRSTYSSSEPGEQSLRVERGQGVQLLQRHDERLHRRRVHEVEV